MDLKNVLRTTKIFHDLTEEELEEVSFSITEQQYAKNSIIIDEGSVTESLYIIKAGQVSIEIPMGGDPLQLATLGPGDFFGEMGLILSLAHSASARAIGETTILIIPRIDLDVILNWNVMLSAKIWKAFSEELAQRVLETNKKLKDFYQICSAKLNESENKNLQEISKSIFLLRKED